MKINSDSKFFKYGLILVCLVLLIILYSQKRTRSQYAEAKQLPFYNTAIESVADGVYVGKTDTSFCHVQLEVTVENHQIKNITILEKKGSKGKNVDSIIQEMIEQNKTVVPAIKGEELASLVFISCADNAIHQGLNYEDNLSPSKN